MVIHGVILRLLHYYLQPRSLAGEAFSNIPNVYTHLLDIYYYIHQYKLIDHFADAILTKHTSRMPLLLRHSKPELEIYHKDPLEYWWLVYIASEKLHNFSLLNGRPIRPIMHNTLLTQRIGQIIFDFKAIEHKKKTDTCYRQDNLFITH